MVHLAEFILSSSLNTTKLSAIRKSFKYNNLSLFMNHPENIKITCTFMDEHQMNKYYVLK